MTLLELDFLCALKLFDSSSFMGVVFSHHTRSFLEVSGYLVQALPRSEFSGLGFFFFFSFY